MTYKSSLQLYFHPSAFLSPQVNTTRPNAAIGLTYINPTQPLSTILRFFLQLLRASLQALPQASTPVTSLLNLVSSGWDTAIQVAECERSLSIEGLTETRIISDERLLVSSLILLPKVRTKVRVSFEVAAAVGEDLALRETVGVDARVVYGERYNERKMVESVKAVIGGGVEGWESAMRDLKQKLLVRGAKGLRK
jgi:kinetochore protein Spc7/SPC105